MKTTNDDFDTKTIIKLSRERERKSVANFLGCDVSEIVERKTKPYIKILQNLFGYYVAVYDRRPWVLIDGDYQYFQANAATFYPMEYYQKFLMKGM